MIIIRIQFDAALTIPGLPVQKDIEPAKHEGWLFRVEGDRLVITSPRDHLSGGAAEAVRDELAAAGQTVSDAIYVLTEPLSRVRLTLLDDGITNVIEGPSLALRATRAKAQQIIVDANAAVEQPVEVESVKRRRPGPKPLNVPPGFRGNPTPPPSPPEEDAP